MRIIDWAFGVVLFAASALFWALVALMLAGWVSFGAVFAVSLLLGLFCWMICVVGGP
jgi:hypothetical protein